MPKRDFFSKKCFFSINDAAFVYYLHFIHRRKMYFLESYHIYNLYVYPLSIENDKQREQPFQFLA